MVQNQLIEMTISVEDKCPVGRFFSVEGVEKVWVFVLQITIKFKSKGEKHLHQRCALNVLMWKK
jgi:hypothetical protein